MLNKTKGCHFENINMLLWNNYSNNKLQEKRYTYRQTEIKIVFVSEFNTISNTISTSQEHYYYLQINICEGSYCTYVRLFCFESPSYALIRDCFVLSHHDWSKTVLFWVTMICTDPRLFCFESLSYALIRDCFVMRLRHMH